MHTLPDRFRVAFGLIGSLLLAGTITVVLAFGRGYYDEGYEISAVFATSSQGLFTDGGSAVKLRGVTVGQVGKIDLLPDGRARVSLSLDDGVRVPDTAMASIEPLSIFGPKVVRLDPGDGEGVGPFLDDGDEIVRTQTQRELTDILASATELFDHVDPADLVVTIDAIAEGTSGLGPELGRAIDATSVLADIAASHAGDIRQFLGDVALLGDTVAAHGDDIVAIAGHTEELLGTLNERPDRLERLLEVTTDISSAFADLLIDNEAELDATIRSVGSFIANVEVEADEIPEFIDLLGTFFGRLSDVIRFDGPNDTRMAGLRGFVSLDLCFVYGVCPLAPMSAAAPVDPSTPSADVVDARALRAMADSSAPTGPLADFVALMTGGRP